MHIARHTVSAYWAILIIVCIGAAATHLILRTIDTVSFEYADVANVQM